MSHFIVEEKSWIIEEGDSFLLSACFHLVSVIVRLEWSGLSESHVFGLVVVQFRQVRVERGLEQNKQFHEKSLLTYPFSSTLDIHAQVYLIK
jgi:hypothetical protein